MVVWGVQCALATESTSIRVLASGSVSAFSNAYTLEEISRNRFSGPDVSSPYPFATVTSSLGLAVRRKNCWLGAQHAQTGAARARQDSLHAYALYEAKQYKQLSSISSAISFQFLAYTGYGAQLGCDWPVSAFNVRLQVNALHIDSLRYRRYTGQVASSGEVARVGLAEELAGFEPHIPGLQPKADRGSVLSADMLLSYRAADETVHAEVFIQNMAGELQAKNTPFLRRNANVSLDASGVAGDGRLNRVVGAYGTEDMRVSLPRIWSAQGSIAMKDRLIYGGAQVIGLNSSLHPMLTVRLRCSMCLFDEGYQLGADTRGKFVSLGYKRGNFRGSLAHRVESLSLGALNAISLSYVRNF